MAKFRCYESQLSSYLKIARSLIPEAVPTRQAQLCIRLFSRYVGLHIIASSYYWHGVKQLR